MTSTRQTEVADSYGLVLPTEWTEVPLDENEFASYRRDVLRDFRQVDGWSRSAERQIELVLTQIRNDLRSANARLAAVVAESEKSGEGLVLTVAAVTVSRVDRAALGIRAPVTADTLVAALGQQPREDGRVRYVNLEPANRIDLPAGPAVRIRRRYTSSPAPAQVIEYYADIFLVPHDAGQAVCTVQFTTPNVEDGSAFSPLFEAIARTLRIFMPGDPTEFSDSGSGG